MGLRLCTGSLTHPAVPNLVPTTLSFGHQAPHFRETSVQRILSRFMAFSTTAVKGVPVDLRESRGWKVHPASPLPLLIGQS